MKDRHSMQRSATKTPTSRSVWGLLDRFLARFDPLLDAHPGLTAVVLYLTALALRLTYLADFRGTLLAQAPLLDEALYLDEAWNLVRGVPPSSDTYFMTPFYPFFLSLVFRCFENAPLAPHAVQLALGALTPVMTFLLARRALRSSFALCAGAGLVTFAPLVFYETLLLVEGLVLLALVMSLLLAVLGPSRGRFALMSGVFLGLAALGRGSNLVLLVPLVVWFWLQGRPSRRVALAFGAGVLLILAPLFVRNTIRAGKPFFLTANAGFNFYLGNGPQATGLFVRITNLDLAHDPHTVRYVQRELRRPVTASEASDYWFETTLDHIRQNPLRAADLLAWKVLLFWNRLSIPQIESFEFGSQDTILARFPYWQSYALFPLALFGIGFSVVQFARKRNGLSASDQVVLLLSVCTVLYSLSIALFFVTDRYRMPVVPLLMVLAVRGLVLVERPTRNQRRRLFFWMFFLGFCFWITDPQRIPVDRKSLERDIHVHNAMRYAKIDRFEEALHEFGDALTLDPSNPDVRDGLARMSSRSGDSKRALLEFRALLEEHPDRAESWYNLGNLHRRLGQQEQAMDAYRRSLDLEPDQESTWNNLGESYRALGDTVEAARCYESALAIVPAYPRALNNLAALRAEQGHAARAESGFRAAVAANPRYVPALTNLAILLTNSGRLEEALATWRRILVLEPEQKLAARMARDLESRIR